MVSTFSQSTPDSTQLEPPFNDKPAAVWYFAYGSNLSTKRMNDRTKEEHDTRGALLRGYRVAFNKRGQNGQRFANIIPDANSVVHGVIYRCSKKAMERLGTYEGGYSPKHVFVETTDGRTTKAVAYIADKPVDECSPDVYYLDIIVAGAQEHGLPEEYIAQLEKHADGLPQRSER